MIEREFFVRSMILAFPAGGRGGRTGSDLTYQNNLRVPRSFAHSTQACVMSIDGSADAAHGELDR